MAQKKSKRYRERYRDAKRDVKQASRPYLQDLRDEKREAKDTMQESQTRVQDIYAGLANQLQSIGQDYSSQMKGLPGELNASIGGLSSMLGMGPANESGAAMNVLGSIGASSQGLLANDKSRGIAFNTSVQRQGAIDSATLQRNYMEDYRDIVASLQNARQDEKQNWPALIQQRMDELKEQRWQKMMAQKEYELREFQVHKQEGRADQAQRQENRATEFALTEAERDRLRQVLKPLKNRLGNVNEDIKEFKGAYAPNERDRPSYQQGIKELRTKRRRTKSKIQKKRRTYNKRHGT